MAALATKLTPQTDDAKARTRTAAELIVPFLLVWLQNKVGFDLVAWVADWTTMSVTTVNMALLVSVGYVLYWFSQHVPVVDRLLHVGVVGTPVYEARVVEEYTPQHAVSAAPATELIPPVDGGVMSSEEWAAHVQVAKRLIGDDGFEPLPEEATWTEGDG